MERGVAHDLGDPTRSNALGTRLDRLVRTIRRGHMHFLQVRFELSARNAGNLPTPPKYFFLPRIATELPIWAPLPHTLHSRAIELVLVSDCLFQIGSFGWYRR